MLFIILKVITRNITKIIYGKGKKKGMKVLHYKNKFKNFKSNGRK
jgi:hypothetical protein